MTPALHPLLLRLLRRVGATTEAAPPPEAWQTLLGLLSRTYYDADQDRYTLERSIDISSRELQGLYQNLKKQSSAVIRATLESVNGAVVVVDKDRRLVAINRQFATMFEIPDDVMASNDHAQIAAACVKMYLDPVSALAQVKAIHATQTVHKQELELTNGKIIERYSAPIHTPDGELVGRVTFFRDITAERTLNHQLEVAREAAEAASNAKSTFLASMSHELRTPLNAVIGLSELLMIDGAAPLTSQQLEFVDGIAGAGRHLLALVNDVLDLSKIEAGKQDLAIERIAAHEVVEDALSMLAPLALHRGVSLGAQLGDPHFIQADPLRMRQILYNLLSNAVKFTDRNGVVSVSTAVDGDRLAIVVADSGIGIPSEAMSRLFRAFEQVSSSSNDRPAGTGLGLALTKRLVDMHNGTIDVTSRVGEGTTFTVRMPLA